MKRRIASIVLAIMVACTFSFGFCAADVSAASKPAAVKGLKVTPVSETSIHVSWGKVKGAKGYEVYRDGMFSRVVNGTAYSDNGLQEGTIYDYKVRAFKKGKVKKYWYNKKTGKWQKKKPKKKWRGKSKKIATKVYGKFSTVKSCWTFGESCDDYDYDYDYPDGSTYTQPNTDKARQTIKLYNNGKEVTSGKAWGLIGKTYTVTAQASSGLPVTYKSYNESVATVDSNGRITCKNVGQATIAYTQAGNNAYGYASAYLVFTVRGKKTADNYGFDVGAYSTKSQCKTMRDDQMSDSGIASYEAVFRCDANADWLNTVEFVAEEVSPVPVRNAMMDLGANRSMSAINAKVTDTLSTDIQAILPPFPEGATSSDRVKCASMARVTFTAGLGISVVKLSAVKDGEVLDYIYLSSSGLTSKDEEAKALSTLYRTARERIEAKIWTASMNNCQKLQALGQYIGSQSHYPGSDSCSQESNPSYWNEWSVEGKISWRSMSNSTMSRIMALQRGMITCQAQSILIRAATEELGLPYLYVDGQIQPGEGVYTEMGVYGNPMHETCVYVDSAGEKHYIDTQGIDYGTCDQHGCRQKMIPFK